MINVARGKWVKKLILFLTVFLLCSCVAKKPIVEIPKSESDFTMSPTEILKVYPSIKENSLEYIADATSKIPPYSTFEQQWGTPVSKQKEWAQYIARVGYNFGLGYSALGELTTSWPVFGAIVTLPAPTPNQTYTWDKGDYSIDVTFANLMFGNGKEPLYWKWRKKGDETSLLTAPKKRPFYFMLGYTSGGDDAFFSNNGSTVHSIGFGTTLMLGYELQLPYENSYSIKIESGIKYTGFIIPQAGARLVENPINVLVATKIMDDPVYLGLGMGYKVSPTLYGGQGQNTTKLDNAISGIIQLEYKSTSKTSVLFRYEYLSYTNSALPKIKANNFGTYLAYYF